MIDTAVITRMIEQQIAETVSSHVSGVLTSDDWAKPLEDKILKFTQDRILSKFASSTAMPEIIEAVKTSVGELFANGNIPGIAQFVDTAVIKTAVDHEVERITQAAVVELF